jgi:hypothetical protein
MKYQTGASSQATRQKKAAAALSLAAIAATVILASITHAYEFGYRAFIAGLISLALLCGMSVLYQRTKKKVFLFFYGLLNAWVIIGFGLLNGFWNHSFKVFLFYLHNGALPPFLAKLFMTPHIGSFFYEGVGVLTFVMSMVASYYGYKLIKEEH